MLATGTTTAVLNLENSLESLFLGTREPYRMY